MTILLRLALISIVLVLPACGPTGASAPQGVDVEAANGNLTIATDYEHMALTGTYEKDGRFVTFETRRGAPTSTAEFEAPDPDAPPFEYDIRFLDWNDGVFYTQLGGDGYLDPTWANHPDLPKTELAERPIAFAMAREAVILLEDELIDPAFDPEAEGLLDLASTSFAPDMPDEVDPLDDDNAGVTPPKERSTTYHNNLFIRRKDALFSGSPADHSALWLKVYLGSMKISETATSNHGTSASSSTMTTACSTNVDFSAPIKLADLVCTTPYFPVGFGVHVCNDDTYVEYDEAKHLYTSTRSECSNTPNWYAPTCF